MAKGMKKIKGGITAPDGFKAWGLHAGIKPHSDMLDIGMIVGDSLCACAGVVTQNKIRSAAADWDEALFKRATARAVVVNSGNANACTGRRGVKDNLAMAKAAAASLGCIPDEVAVCSTGVIGEFLPMPRVQTGIARLAGMLSAGLRGGRLFAKGIMTTDTRVKEHACEARTTSGSFRVGGAAKGSGMIGPNMATLLCFLSTDAVVTPAYLRKIVRKAADVSFGRISIDGHTSTSDTVCVLASGASNVKVRQGTPEGDAFEKAIFCVMRKLSRKVVMDGEGATKLIDFHVLGAASDKDLHRVGRVLMQSPLNKTMFFGEDLNWGRLVSSVGYSGAAFEVADLVLKIDRYVVFSRGMPNARGIQQATPLLKRREIKVVVNLGAGSHEGVFTTCDLSYDYVKINADYRT